MCVGISLFFWRGKELQPLLERGKQSGEYFENIHTYVYIYIYIYIYLYVYIIPAWNSLATFFGGLVYGPPPFCIVKGLSSSKRLTSRVYRYTLAWLSFNFPPPIQASYMNKVMFENLLKIWNKHVVLILNFEMCVFWMMRRSTCRWHPMTNSNEVHSIFHEFGGIKLSYRCFALVKIVHCCVQGSGQRLQNNSHHQYMYIYMYGILAASIFHLSCIHHTFTIYLSLTLIFHLSGIHRTCIIHLS